MKNMKKCGLNIKTQRPKILYDGECCFCCSSIKLLQSMDVWKKIEYFPGAKGLSEMRLEYPDGKSYGGFFAFRQLVWMLPMLYVMIPIVYFPGSSIVGPAVYRWIAKRRHLFPMRQSFSKGSCHQ